MFVQAGSLYYVRISATNAAGLVGSADSQAVKVTSGVPDLTPAKLVGIILGVVLGTAVLVAAVTIWLTQIRCAHTPALVTTDYATQTPQAHWDCIVEAVLTIEDAAHACMS